MPNEKKIKYMANNHQTQDDIGNITFHISKNGNVFSVRNTGNRIYFTVGILTRGKISFWCLDKYSAIIVFVDITKCILASKWCSILKGFEITLFFPLFSFYLITCNLCYDGIIDVQISAEEKKQLSQTSNPAILTIMTMTLIYICWIEKWH